LGPLGIDRSEIFRDALHRHLVVLNGEAMRSGRRTSPVLVLTPRSRRRSGRVSRRGGADLDATRARLGAAAYN
jgi:hypothetical protein